MTSEPSSFISLVAFTSTITFHRRNSCRPFMIFNFLHLLPLLVPRSSYHTTKPHSLFQGQSGDNMQREAHFYTSRSQTPPPTFRLIFFSHRQMRTSPTALLLNPHGMKPLPHMLSILSYPSSYPQVIQLTFSYLSLDLFFTINVHHFLTFFLFIFPKFVMHTSLVHCITFILC